MLGLDGSFHKQKGRHSTAFRHELGQLTTWSSRQERLNFLVVRHTVHHPPTLDSDIVDKWHLEQNWGVSLHGDDGKAMLENLRLLSIRTYSEEEIQLESRRSER